MSDDIRSDRSRSTRTVNAADVSTQEEVEIQPEQQNTVLVNLFEKQLESQKQMIEMLTNAFAANVNANRTSNNNSNSNNNNRLNNAGFSGGSGFSGGAGSGFKC